MRRFSQWNWQRPVMGAAAIAAFAVFVGFAPTTASAQCVGDCNGDNEVTVDEIITMVNISLELTPVSACTAGDPGNDGAITVDEIIQAVNFALTVCPMVVDARCGDGITSSAPPAEEECDNGGQCVGGPNAGTNCDAEADCTGNGVCAGGAGVGKSCAVDGDCAGSTCVRCKTFGGDGCAANCTLETTVTYNLVPGVVAPPPNSLEIVAGTSGAVVHGDPLTIPLPITGTQNLIVGKPRNGSTPFVIPAASVQFPQIPVATLACACVRGVEFKTCGGTIFETDGLTLTPSCTEGFSGQMACPAEKPCAFVHGPGNSASGEVACGPGATGLAGIDVTIEQDAGGPDVEAGPAMITLSGQGGVGSARLVNSTAIGTAVGRCTGVGEAWGPDGMFCTGDDGASARGTPQTLPFTTGRACATVFNANDDDTFDIGPFCYDGSSANCSNLTASPPVLTGLSTAGSFPAVNQQTVGDIAVTSRFVAQ